LLGYPADVVESSVMPFVPWWLVGIGIMLALIGVALIHRILKKSVPSVPSV
jgi:hypothetical protein